MIRSQKRIEKIRKMYEQGYGVQNICLMEGITSEELQNILKPSESPAIKVNLTPLQKRILTGLHQTDCPRSTAALSGMLGEPKSLLQDALDGLKNDSLVTESDLWARPYPAYWITEAGIEALKQVLS